MAHKKHAQAYKEHKQQWNPFYKQIYNNIARKLQNCWTHKILTSYQKC